MTPSSPRESLGRREGWRVGEGEGGREEEREREKPYPWGVTQSGIVHYPELGGAESDRGE